MMAKDNNTYSRRRGASPASREENGVENVDFNTEPSAQCILSDVDRMTATLPLWELAIYFLGWSGAIAYGCYDVYLASAKNAKSLAKYYDFEDGWAFLQRKRDPTNFEWEFYRGWMLKIWPWFVGHVLVGQVCRRLEYKARVYMFMLYGMLAIGIILGLKAIVLIMAHCIITYVAALSQQTLVVWAASLMLLVTITLEQYFPWLTEYFNDSDSTQLRYYLLNFSLAMTNIKITSFCLVMANQRKHYSRTPVEPGERRRKYSLFDMFVYIFYFPLYFCGPIVTFDDFYKQLNAPMQPWTSWRIMYMVKEVFRIIFWTLFVEFILYFFYFNAMRHDLGRMQSMPLTTLSSIGWMQLQFFMLKYIVLFGIPRVFAQMDQFDPPDGPKCISRIHTLSLLWRTFDTGLHNFMIRHIYIPLGGSRHGVLMQTFATFCCFAYVWFWHGAEDFLFIWTSLNYLGILCEVAGAQFMKQPSVKQLEERFLSPAMGRRLRAIAIAPITILSYASALYFLAGKQVGLIYTKRLPMDPLPALWLVLLFYCCAQTSIAAGMNETTTPLMWQSEEEMPDKCDLQKEPSEAELKGSGQNTPKAKKSGSKLSQVSKRSSRTSRRKQ